MKRITLIICLVFCCFNLFAQRGFPKSAKEDKEKIMSEGLLEYLESKGTG